MSSTQIKTKPVENCVSVMDAIYGRRSVRDYKPDCIDQATIQKLLKAAVQAPTAMHEEPWAFVVIQDKTTLNRLSDRTKELLTSGLNAIHPLGVRHGMERFTQAEFNVFYNARTLIVICGKPVGPFVVSDCWLAAENLMLAAYAEGLGTCVIGLAVSTLNTVEWKLELDIPEAYTVFAPIIVGVPNGETPIVPRNPPQILTWKSLTAFA